MNKIQKWVPVGAGSGLTDFFDLFFDVGFDIWGVDIAFFDRFLLDDLFCWCCEIGCFSICVVENDSIDGVIYNCGSIKSMVSFNTVFVMNLCRLNILFYTIECADSVFKNIF